MNGMILCTGTATLIPICPGSACNSNFLAAAPLFVFCQYPGISEKNERTKRAAPFPLSCQLHPFSEWVTYYLLALMISIASSIVSAATILKTGPKISFLSLALSSGANILVSIHIGRNLHNSRSNKVSIGVFGNCTSSSI